LDRSRPHPARRVMNPAQPKCLSEAGTELEAMRAAAKELDQMIAAWGASEDEPMESIR
jgi:hypothetical protein